MKHSIFIIFFFFWVTQNIYSQKHPPLGYYKNVYLGMAEEEFTQKFKEKYNTSIATTIKGVFAGLSYNSKKHAFRLTTSRFKMPDNVIGESKVLYNNIELTFVNKQLYKIEIWKEEKEISKKESVDVLNYLNMEYQTNRCKALFDKRPDKKAKRYHGSRTYSSQPKINGQLSPLSNTIWYSYQIKDKHRLFRPNRIVIKDNATELYWKEFIKMINEFDKKGFKAFNSFRGISIGMPHKMVNEKLGGNLRFVNDSVVAKAYKDTKFKDVYLKYDAYIDTKPAPLMGVTLTEVDYFFYEDKLAVIRCLFDRDADLLEFEKGLKQVYGEAMKAYKDGSSSRMYEIKNEILNKHIYEFWLQLSKGTEEKPCALTYRENVAFRRLTQQVKDEKKENLKDDF